MPNLVPIYRKVPAAPGPGDRAVAFTRNQRAMAGQSIDKDLPVLASASACRADYLVTGDKRTLPRQRKAAILFSNREPGGIPRRGFAGIDCIMKYDIPELPKTSDLRKVDAT